MNPVTDTIERLIVRHCALPVLSARDHGSGLVSDTVEIVVLELRTSAGIVGWGEASPWAVFTGTAEANAAALARYIAPQIIGKPIADVARIMQIADACVVAHPEAKTALETALLDAVGQGCGMPIWALLGGRVRDRIPLSVSLADPDFDRDIELLTRLVADGVGIVKLKTGTREAAFDTMRLERIRTEFPGVRVRVDYNQGLRDGDVLRRLRDVEAFDVDFIEQPVPGDRRDAMRELAAALDTPLLADESVFSPTDMLVAARDRLCDYVSVKIMKTGGLRRAHEVAAIAGAAGMHGYGGDMFESGIAHLAGTHMIASAPNISLGCEFYQAHYYLERDLLTTPPPVDNGDVIVPDTPGLGATPDLDYLSHCTLLAREVGAT